MEEFVLQLHSVVLPGHQPQERHGALAPATTPSGDRLWRGAATPWTSNFFRHLATFRTRCTPRSTRSRLRVPDVCVIGPRLPWPRSLAAPTLPAASRHRSQASNPPHDAPPDSGTTCLVRFWLSGTCTPCSLLVAPFGATRNRIVPLRCSGVAALGIAKAPIREPVCTWDDKEDWLDAEDQSRSCGRSRVQSSQGETG
jgi:hypothetical protein